MGLPDSLLTIHKALKMYPDCKWVYSHHHLVLSTASLDAACNRDTKECSANLFSTQVGTGCDAATTISVKYQIVDNDDNTSNSITVDGRVGEDFEG